MDLNYSIIGSGKTLVFLHGYLENLGIWTDFTKEFSAKYQILLLDLPGHGKSTCNQEKISMDFMAAQIYELINHLNIEEVTIIGHSMGGYVALAFAERFPEKLKGLCLFHSSPNPDNDEKAKTRLGDIDLVLHGRSDIIFERNIPKLFADDNLLKFKNQVEVVKEMAKSTPDKGIIGALYGMAERPDRNQILEQLNCPSMMIFGRKDNLIPITVAESLAGRHKKTRTVYLDNSGHMGFIEEKDQAQLAIASFLNRVFV